ncbi:MAG TPA: hypothetical protein VFN95_16465 [Flavitalea sp.]|jgi:hypothetical protein|nr:hypothetical protein [Flavitalea sp.]
MQEDEVPQDEKNLNEGKLAKLYYATDAKGHYTKVNSVGWEPETVAMQQAWDVVHAEVEAARKKVIEGKASPVLYYLKKNIMNVSMVAGYMGTLSLVVRLHMLPFFFNKLSRKTLERYAYTFRITVDELLDIEQLKTKNES